MSVLSEVNLEHQQIGNSGAHIVFLNGFRMHFNSWHKVYSELTSENRVTLFNRRGVGASPKATKAQDAHTVISEMRFMLSKLKIPSSHVLVAHSLGGLFANLYARAYPSDVAGIVFVEAAHPVEVAEQKKYSPPLLLSAINNCVKSVEKLFDKYRYSEDECVEDTIAQIFNAESFPDIPIAVVSGTKRMPFVPETAFKEHLKYQDELMKVAPKSTHYFCHESGHFPQISEPGKVILAIRNIINEIAVS